MAFIIGEHTATCSIMQYGWERIGSGGTEEVIMQEKPP